MSDVIMGASSAGNRFAIGSDVCGAVQRLNLRTSHSCTSTISVLRRSQSTTRRHRSTSARPTDRWTNLNVFTDTASIPVRTTSAAPCSCDTSTSSAIDRDDQCVSPSAVEFIGGLTISSILDCGDRRLRAHALPYLPELDQPLPRQNRVPPTVTVGRAAPRTSAIDPTIRPLPSAASSTMPSPGLASSRTGADRRPDHPGQNVSRSPSGNLQSRLYRTHTRVSRTKTRQDTSGATALAGRTPWVRSRSRVFRVTGGVVMMTLAVALTFNLTDGLQRRTPTYTRSGPGRHRGKRPSAAGTAANHLSETRRRAGRQHH